MKTSQSLQLPLLQYNKLLKYKDTLGCSSDAELVGLLTQTFLHTLAQPLSISSKEVDLLLSQGQGEPKIRHIMMALLIQCLSPPTEIQKEQPLLLRSHSPLLDSPPHLSPLSNLRLHTVAAADTSPRRPSPLLTATSSSPLSTAAGPRKSSFTTYSSSHSTSHVKRESPAAVPVSTTPWILAPVEGGPTSAAAAAAAPSPLQVPTPVISLSSILSTPPIQSPDGESILIPVDSSMFHNVTLTSQTTTPVATPEKSKQDSSPLVTVLDDSLLLHKQSPCQTEGGEEADIEAAVEQVVQGPTTNACLSDVTSASSGMSSPVSSLERNSPISSFPDTNGVDLNEVLKVLSSENGCSESQDEVVNKLVTIINELVETTEISMEDIIEMMKSSVECQGEEVMGSHDNTDILQPAVVLEAKQEPVTSEPVTSSCIPGMVPVFGGLSGLIMPNNWTQLSLQSLTTPTKATNLHGANTYHPYHTKQQRTTPTTNLHDNNMVTPLRSADKKSNVCSTCNTSFSQFSSLLRHIRQVHQKIKDKPCTICGERFARSQYLPNHIWRTHYNRATSNVKCFFCPEVLSTKEGIQQHLWLNHVKARR